MNNSFRRILAAIAGCLCLSPFAAGPLAPDTPLVTDGPIVVDVADFNGAMLRIPDQYRGEVLMSRDHIATLVDQVFVARSLAARARKEGLDKDPAVQARLVQVQDDFLADLYLKKFQKDAMSGNLDQRARELYDADPAKYTTPAQVDVQQVLIDLKGRTREMAKQRAEDVYEQATSGKEEFLALALKYSDEPTRTGMRGDLGWNVASSFVAPVRDALAKMKKGEISKPVESEYGFHILKLVDRKPAELLKFEAVKDRIIADEKARVVKDRVDALMRQIRSSPTAKVDTAKVDQLVVPIDPKAVERALEGKAAAGKAAK